MINNMSGVSASTVLIIIVKGMHAKREEQPARIEGYDAFFMYKRSDIPPPKRIPIPTPTPKKRIVEVAFFDTYVCVCVWELFHREKNDKALS